MLTCAQLTVLMMLDVRTKGVWDDLTDAEACSIVAAVREKNQQAAAAATEHEKMVLACPALALCQEAYRRGERECTPAHLPGRGSRESRVWQSQRAHHRCLCTNVTPTCRL